MTIRTFLTGIAAASLICFLSWLAVGVFFDPETAGWTGLILFYFSLFSWVCGVLILIGFYARYILKPDASPYPLIAVSVRQAAIISITLVIFMILKGARMLNWVNGAFLLIAVVFIEGYFLTSNHERLRRNQ